MATRIEPRADYTPRKPMRITPNPNYKVRNMHSQRFMSTGPIKTVEAEWCPVCHSGKDRISERMVNNRPVWHCDECGQEW